MVDTLLVQAEGILDLVATVRSMLACCSWLHALPEGQLLLQPGWVLSYMEPVAPP